MTTYQQLSRARDLAAYRALGHIDAAICYARQGDTQTVLSILLSARELYEKAARALDSLNSSSTGKGNSHNGNTSNSGDRA